MYYKVQGARIKVQDVIACPDCLVPCALSLRVAPCALCLAHISL